MVAQRLLIAMVGLLAVACAGAARAQGVMFTVQDGQPGAYFGGSVAGAGDFDGDGILDVVVGAFAYDGPAGTSTGKARVVSGRTGANLLVVVGPSLNGFMGSAVAGAGDVNADGFADVIIGAMQTVGPGGTLGSGSAFVYSGKDQSLLHHLAGLDGYDKFGQAVDGIGDVDGDGHADLLVGAPDGDVPGGANFGEVFVYSGATGKLIRSHGGTEQGDFGASVAGVGDIDKDGVGDYVVGAPFGLVTLGPGEEARVYSGKSGDLLYTLREEGEPRLFGRSVGGAGDVNADGWPDIVVGAPTDSKTKQYAGSARVYSGRNGALLQAIFGEGKWDYLGTSVDGAGDVNGDGRADIVVGAPGVDTAVDDGGMVLVASGADGSALAELYSNNAGAELGRSVAGAGDINRDGFGDVVAGAPEFSILGPLSPGPGRVRVYSGSCGLVTSSGTGCAGTGGLVPTLSLAGCATPLGTMTVRVDDVAGGALIALFVSPAPGATSSSPCLALAEPILGTILLEASAGSVFGGGGKVSLTDKLPVNTQGLSFAMQALVADAGATGGVVSTNVISVALP